MLVDMPKPIEPAKYKVKYVYGQKKYKDMLLLVSVTISCGLLSP